MSRVIIDVREKFEFKMGHVKDAVNIPVMDIVNGLPAQLKDISKDSEIIVYCMSGSRASAAIPYLQKYGFKNVINGINKSHVKTLI